MLSEQISKFRKMSGLSQEELGSVLAVSRQTISKWESGQSSPDVDSIKKMKDIFEVNYDELLDGSSPSPSIHIQNLRKEKYTFIFATAMMIQATVLLLTYLLLRTSNWYVAYSFQQNMLTQAPANSTWFISKLNLLSFIDYGLPFIIAIFYSLSLFAYIKYFLNKR